MNNTVQCESTDELLDRMQTGAMRVVSRSRRPLGHHLRDLRSRCLQIFARCLVKRSISFDLRGTNDSVPTGSTRTDCLNQPGGLSLAGRLYFFGAGKVFISLAATSATPSIPHNLVHGVLNVLAIPFDDHHHQVLNLSLSSGSERWYQSLWICGID